MTENNIKILLLDSNSLINRAFHALPPLVNNDGVFTNAIYGYMNMLSKLLAEEHPTHICAVFDCRAKTFRHNMFDQYKGTRKPMPEELAMQVPVLQNLLKKMNICILYKEGYEADDILGTLSKRFKEQTIIVSGDRDCLQLVDNTTTVFNTKKGISDVIKYTPERLAEEGFTPQQIIEYKALAGDSSDNIPGCPGVGQKTATDLLCKYGSVDGIYENIQYIGGKLKEKLINAKEIIQLSKALATINIDTPIECSLDDLQYNYVVNQEAKDLMQYLQFKNLTEKFLSLTSNTQVKFQKEKDLDTENKVAETQIIKKIDAEKIVVDNENTLSETLFRFRNDHELFLEFNETNIIIANKGLICEINISNDLLGDGLNPETVIEHIQPFLEKNYNKILYNAKNSLHFLSNYGISLDMPYNDILLMAYLINNTKTIKTKEQLLEDYCYSTENYPAAFIDLYGIFVSKIEQKNLNQLYYNIELPLIEVLYVMEKTGFTINSDMLNELNAKYTTEINSLIEEIYNIAGEVFNINSNKQLASILFDKLQLPHSKKTKTGYSVDADALEELDHPIITAILRYRELTKLKSTYIEGMKSVINPITGKVHTCFNQCITATGRLSSTEPNLQNIPIRRNEGREIRKMFVPSPGNSLVTADYSQIELRLLAHFSEEPKLIEAYNNQGDIHALTASKIFKVPLEMVTPEMRSSAKAVNFGIIYGISGFGLAKNAGVSRFTAKNFIDQYFITYPKIKEYMDKNVTLAKNQGYLTTMYGRIRYFPELTSPKHNIRAFGERAAMNMPLQGTASDIIKIAMLNVFNALKTNNLKAKLILQVHDELIIDTPNNEVDIVKNILKQSMESAAKLRVPLTANIAYGANWYVSK